MVHARLQHGHAAVEIEGRQMGVAHRHRQGLMTQPHLNPTNVNAALDQPRGAGVAKDVGDEILVVDQSHLGFRVVPHGAVAMRLDMTERPLGTRWPHSDHLGGTPRKRNRPAAAGFRDPEGDTLAVDVRPPYLQCFAQASAGVDEKDAEAPAILRAIPDLRKQQGFLGSVQEADAALTLLLAAELWQAVYVTHLVSLAQQLSQRRKFPVDGRIAVAVFAQPADQKVERVLAEHAELATEQKLIQFADEEGDVVLDRKSTRLNSSH